MITVFIFNYSIHVLACCITSLSVYMFVQSKANQEISVPILYNLHLFLTENRQSMRIYGIAHTHKNVLTS